MNRKIIFGTLIGYYVEIIESSNRNYIGIKGKVVDETRKTLVIKSDKGLKRVGKKGCIFKVIRDGDKLILKGDELVGDIFRRVIEIG